MVAYVLFMFFIPFMFFPDDPKVKTQKNPNFSLTSQSNPCYPNLSLLFRVFNGFWPCRAPIWPGKEASHDPWDAPVYRDP